MTPCICRQCRDHSDAGFRRRGGQFTITDKALPPMQSYFPKITRRIAASGSMMPALRAEIGRHLPLPPEDGN